MIRRVESFGRFVDGAAAFDGPANYRDKSSVGHGSGGDSFDFGQLATRYWIDSG